MADHTRAILLQLQIAATACSVKWAHCRHAASRRPGSRPGRPERILVTPWHDGSQPNHDIHARRSEGASAFARYLVNLPESGPSDPLDRPGLCCAPLQGERSADSDVFKVLGSASRAAIPCCTSNERSRPSQQGQPPTIIERKGFGTMRTFPAKRLRMQVADFQSYIPSLTVCFRNSLRTVVKVRASQGGWPLIRNLFKRHY